MVKISKVVCLIAAICCMIVAFRLGFELAIAGTLLAWCWKGPIILAAAIAAGRCIGCFLDEVLTH